MNDARRYTTSFGFQWLQHARAQLDSVTRLPISRSRLFSVTDWPQRMDGQRILEAGSGAGRFTEILLSTGAEVWSFDASEAVEANRSNNGNHPGLHLFRSDINTLPSDIGLFDKVLCLGVLQHTSDPEKSFRSLVSFVKPGGEIVIDVYKKTWSALFQWKYLLRPLTKRLPPRFLYACIRMLVPIFLPALRIAKKIGGRGAARLFPFVEYSDLGLSPALNREWAILDTFDMYSPRYDTPQTLRAVRRWFEEYGLTDIDVHYGPNGIVGKGKNSVA